MNPDLHCIYSNFRCQKLFLVIKPYYAVYNWNSDRLEHLKAVNIKTVGYETMQCSRWFPVYVPPHGGSIFLQYAANQLPNDIALLLLLLI